MKLNVGIVGKWVIIRTGVLITAKLQDQLKRK